MPAVRTEPAQPTGAARRHGGASRHAAARRPRAERALPYALLAPTVVLLVGLFAIPFVSLFSYALRQFDVDGSSRFVGLVNLTSLLREPHFHDNLVLTAVYLVAVLGLSVPLAYLAALLVVRPARGVSLLRALLLMPWVLAPAVTAVVFRTLADPAQGPISAVGTALFGAPVELSSSVSGSLAVVIAHAVWRSFPLVMLILAAAMSGIPRELYEAVRTDGGGRWREFAHVTLPLTRTSLMSACIMISVFTLHDAESIYALTKGGPGYGTESVAVRLFKEAFLYYNVGGGAALGVVLVVVTVAVLLVLAAVSRRAERNLS